MTDQQSDAIIAQIARQNGHAILLPLLCSGVEVIEHKLAFIQSCDVGVGVLNSHSHWLHKDKVADRQVVMIGDERE